MDYTKIKGDINKFVDRPGGHIGWTFKELCDYLGYNNACKKVIEYKRSFSPQFYDSKLVRDYLKVFGTGFRIELKTKSGKEVIFTDLDGIIIPGGEKFREYEARTKGKSLKVRKIILNDYEK